MKKSETESVSALNKNHRFNNNNWKMCLMGKLYIEDFSSVSQYKLIGVYRSSVTKKKKRIKKKLRLHLFMFLRDEAREKSIINFAPNEGKIKISSFVFSLFLLRVWHRPYQIGH